MNLKGILLLALLAVSGAPVGMSQIVAGKPVPLTVSEAVQPEGKETVPVKAIRITMSGIPPVEQGKINAEYTVSEHGTINLPYVGIINVVGKRPEQLARDIEQAYIDGKIYITPTIIVMWSCENPDPDGYPVIHVGGHVRRPGPVPFAEGMTLWQAIQAAGGETEFASLRRVKLYRDGKQIVYDMVQKENLSVTLKVNDTIELPQRNYGCGEH